MTRRFVHFTLAAAVAVAGVGTGLALAPGHADAAFPGANGKIVFSSHRDDAVPVVSGEIYVMNADGSGQTRLTNNGLSADSDPAWSPNGQKIAWESTQGDNDLEIFVMNANGSGQTQVSDGVSVNESPAWSPDGDKIAFVSPRDGDYEIFVMNADGTGLTQLTHNTLWDENPAWSPDGEKIVFQSTAIGDAGHDILVMNADGTGLTQLPIANEGGVAPTWSPDGQKIAYSGVSSDDQGGLTTGIFIMDADGSNSTVLPVVGSVINPKWSPDGQQFVFTSNTDEPGNSDVYVMDADGQADPQRITTHASDDFTGDWQPLPAGPIDDVAPVVTCDVPTPSFVLGGSHATDVTATVTDAGSGPATSPVTADVTATDVATVGVKSKSLTGLDIAGNSTTVTCPYVVAYAFGSFLSPLPADKNRAGSMIPVKFQLRDASGATIPDAQAQALVGATCAIKVSFDGAAQAGCAAYDAATDTFKFEFKTAKTTPKGSHTISVEIAAPDGSGVIQTQTTQVKVA